MNYSQEENKKRRRKQQSQVPRVKNKISVVIFRVAVMVILIGGFALVGAGLGVYMGIIKNAPTLNLAGIQSENYTSFILDSKTGEEIDRLSGKENRVYVASERIPQNLKNAFVAIEDERFYKHNGVDFRGMVRALFTLVESGGDTTQGASTITQQLIKNILGRYDSDLITKLQEQYLAVQFEKRLAEPDMLGSREAAKDYILSSYMNAINLGRGYYGVQSAAWNYFGKDVSELTLSECAVIAAITQNPSKYPPDIKPDKNRYRQELVLKKMKELEFITESEFNEAWDDQVYDRVIQGVNSVDGSGVVHSYFTDALINNVSKDLQAKFNITENESYNWIYNKGLQIYSTQDRDIQQVVDDVFTNPENFPEGDYEVDVEYRLSVQNNITGKITNHNKKKTVKSMDDVDAFVQATQNELMTSNDDILGEQIITTEQPQASFVMIDYHNGHVVAICGGRGDKPVNRSFSRATDALRSPGSQFKVLASYAPALDLGRITAATVYDDAPYTYDDGISAPYTPNNWWGKTFEGLSNIRRGIYRSMNILAVKNLMALGIDTSFAYLQNFGFKTLVEGEWRGNRWLSDKVPSLTLGGLTDGVRQIELCAAYGTIANMGEYNKPVFYTKVLDHSGNVLLENEPEPRQVLKKTTAYVLTDMMKDTIKVGTGTKAAFQEVKMSIAGKTGTSTDTKDIGFSGYTPYYVASVWMGYDQQKMIRDSNAYHLQIWRKIMEEVHKDLSEKDFDQPEGITYATVCRDSGLLTTDLCSKDPRGSRAYKEVFVSGTQPVDYCEVHQEMLMDTTTNMKASPYCPAESVEMRVGIVRPEPYEGDAAILDRAYEFTPEILNGPECTYHTGSYDYSIPFDYSDFDFNNSSNNTWVVEYNWGQPLETTQPEFPWSTETPAWPTVPSVNDNEQNYTEIPLPEDITDAIP